MGYRDDRAEPSLEQNRRLTVRSRTALRTLFTRNVSDRANVACGSQRALRLVRLSSGVFPARMSPSDNRGSLLNNSDQSSVVAHSTRTR